MRDLNEVHEFIDDDCFDENITGKMKESDSGILYDSGDRMNSSKFSSCELPKNIVKTKNDSGIDIAKMSSSSSTAAHRTTREFSSKQSLVVTAAAPSTSLPAKTASKLRSKRYSLPDIDKLKQYETKQQNNMPRKTSIPSTRAKSSNKINNRKSACDIMLDARAAKPMINAEVAPSEGFVIDPKLINKHDGLSQTLYYIDENGSPKIRERFIQKQRLVLEKREQKRAEKTASQDLDGACFCFNFSKISKKLKEICEYHLRASWTWK